MRNSIARFFCAASCASPDKYEDIDLEKHVSNNNTIKRYHKFQTGMPPVETWGDLTTMLDAVLCNGFNAKTPVSISRVDSTVTVGCVAHGYEADQVLLASGADQPEYNGEHRVTYTTADSYTYELPPGVTPASTGTTLTNFAVKVAPLGFEIYKSGTHRRVYRTLDTTNTNRPCLRVDDGLTFSGSWNATWMRYAKVTMSSDVSDVDTFVGFRSPGTPDAGAPNANEVANALTGTSRRNGWFRWHFRKNRNQTDTTANPAVMARWDLVGDSRGFHFFPSCNDYSFGCTHYSFTEFDSFIPGDTGNAFLQAGEFWGNPDTSTPNEAMYYIGAGNTSVLRSYRSRRILCDHTGFSADEAALFMGPNVGILEHQSGVGAYVPYPNPADYSLVMNEVLLYGSRSGVRGNAPGFLVTPHNRPLAPLAVFGGIPSRPGRKFLVVPIALRESESSSSVGGQIFVDLTGPWRQT